MDDLISVGLNGLCDALDKFQPQNANLKTYTYFRIKGAMLDELRAVEWIPRSRKQKTNALKAVRDKLEKILNRLPEDEEVAKFLNITMNEYFRILEESSNNKFINFEDYENIFQGDDIDRYIEDSNQKNPFNILLQLDQKKILHRLIAELPQKEKTIISMYYFEEMTMKKIGEFIGLSEGRVSQLHHNALRLLKVKMKKLNH